MVVAHALPYARAAVEWRAWPSLGFRADVLQGVIPFFSLYAILLHANVSWSFGPLRYVLASPRFHRWHHTIEAEARDKNFAGIFAFIDLAVEAFRA